MVNVNCEKVWQEISNYVDGEVNPELRSAMEQHFRACTKCASVLAGMQNVIQLYGDERMIEVPSGYGRRLEKRLAQGARVSVGRWSTWSTWLIPVAALALFAGGLRLANSVPVREPLKSEHAQPGQGIPPDMMVVVTKDAKLFHLAGCGVIHNKETARTLTAKEAISDGYVPCLRCMRQYLHTADAGNPELGSEADAHTDADADLDRSDSDGKRR